MAKNSYERYGINSSEVIEALTDAMRQGGASEEEIQESVVAVQVDMALPDDGEWTLRRTT